MNDATGRPGPDTVFRDRVRGALAAPLDGPLAARFVAPLVTALVAHADEGGELTDALAETIAALERVGVPRGRQYVLLAGECPPAVASARAAGLRAELGVPVLVHDAARDGFTAGRLPGALALVLDDELREAEAIVTLAGIARERGGPWRAASLVCPGSCTAPARAAIARAVAGDTGKAWAIAAAAEREAPIDLALWWDGDDAVRAAGGRAALAWLAAAAGHAAA
jgi:hypothetical protein